MRRGGLFVWGSVLPLLTGVATACSSFGGATPNDVADAGPDVAALEASAPNCALPRLAQDAPRTCAGDCAAKTLFPQQLAQRIVVDGTSFYIVQQQSVYATDNVDDVAFERIDTAVPIVGKMPTRMGLDAQFIYVSSENKPVRVPRGGGAETAIPLLDGDNSPVYVGTTTLFQMQPTRVVRSSKDPLVDAGAQSLVVSGTEALALDGDTAYWIGPNSSNAHVILGPFPSLAERGEVTSPVLGFVVKDGFAYVAETATSGGTISRMALLEGGTRTLLVREPGKIESFAFDSGKLYWVALRLPADGGRVLASVDTCGGAATVLATDLVFLSPLAFDARNVYATAQGANEAGGPLYRMRR